MGNLINVHSFPNGSAESKRTPGTSKHIMGKMCYHRCIQTKEASLCTESGEDPLYSPWDTLHNLKKDITGLVPGGEEIGVAYAGTSPAAFVTLLGQGLKVTHRQKTI